MVGWMACEGGGWWWWRLQVHSFIYSTLYVSSVGDVGCQQFCGFIIVWLLPLEKGFDGEKRFVGLEGQAPPEWKAHVSPNRV